MPQFTAVQRRKRDLTPIPAAVREAFSTAEMAAIQLCVPGSTPALPKNSASAETKKIKARALRGKFARAFGDKTNERTT